MSKIILRLFSLHMVKRMRILLPLLFMSIVFVAYSTSINSKKRILLIHSYHPGYSWVRDINIAWKRRFEKQNNAHVRTYYMDTKRFPSLSDKKKSAKSALDLIKSWNPEILVAFDDDAQEFVASRFINKKNISIVYGGVNNDLSLYNYIEANNVYGISERMQLDAFKTALSDLKMHGKKIDGLKIAHLSDQSIFSDNITNQVKNYDWYPHVLVSSTQCNSLQEWKVAVKKADQNADLLFITNYHTLDGQLSGDDTNAKHRQVAVPPKEVINWTTSNTSIPLVGTYGFLVEDGGTLSIGISAFEQGNIAANFTIRLLKDQLIPKASRNVIGQHVIVFMNKKRMTYWGWDLSQLYSSFAEATGNYFRE